MPAEMKVVPPNALAMANTSFIHEREKFCQEAEFASHLIRAWGILAVDDGETSVGHQKHKPIPVDDLVERVVSTTQLAFQRYRELGWIMDMPPIADLLKPQGGKTGF
jgi:hypothetical protein